MVARETSVPEKWQRQSVQIVEKSAKSPSSQLRAGRSIAETVSRNTGNHGTDLINFSPFYKILLRCESFSVNLHHKGMAFSSCLIQWTLWQYHTEEQKNIPSISDLFFMASFQRFMGHKICGKIQALLSWVCLLNRYLGTSFRLLKKHDPKREAFYLIILVDWILGLIVLPLFSYILPEPVEDIK